MMPSLSGVCPLCGRYYKNLYNHAVKVLDRLVREGSIEEERIDGLTFYRVGGVLVLGKITTLREYAKMVRKKGEKAGEKLISDDDYTVKTR